MNSNKKGWMAVIFITLCTNAAAKQEIDQSLPASNNSLIRIEHINGKAEVRGWDKDQVQVKGTLGEKTQEFIFKERNGDIRIEVEVKQKYSWSENNDGDDLFIYVPFGASIQYDSVNANLQLVNLKGSVKAEVVNGSINADQLSGRARFESVNGEIEFADITGDITVETVNGDIQGSHESEKDITLESVNGSVFVHSQSEKIEVESVNGDIELELANVEHLEMTSVNGDIDVTLTLNETGEVEGNTVGGRIALTFDELPSAHFDIEAHAGGKIVNKLTNDKVQKTKYGPRRWLAFSTGKGSAIVNLSTVGGRISVDKKD
jgi:DUF4097 and DUF4098 domain-containing protein YvlB